MPSLGVSRKSCLHCQNNTLLRQMLFRRYLFQEWNKKIKDYVLQTEEAKEFYKKLKDFINFSVPLYIKEGKSSLILAFGCTGGQHRSVTFAELISEELSKAGYNVTVGHRDISKNHI